MYLCIAAYIGFLLMPFVFGSLHFGALCYVKCYSAIRPFGVFKLSFCKCYFSPHYGVSMFCVVLFSLYAPVSVAPSGFNCFYVSV